MFDNLLFTEIMATSRQDAIERGIRHAHDLSVLGHGGSTFSLRGTFAAALVRLAICVDANAGRRAATIAQ